MASSGWTVCRIFATASVVAGASFGYKLLWVQPLAMFLGVMMLAAEKGVVLKVRAQGPDAREAVQALQELFASGFGEEI